MRYKQLLVVAVAVLLSGCFNNHLHTAYRGCQSPGQVVRVGLGGDIYDYARRPLEPVLRRGDDAPPGYRVHRIAFPSVGENGQQGNLVRAIYYESTAAGAPKPLIIVLPIWGVQAYPARTMSEGLVEHSRGKFNVLRILGENYLFDWQALQHAPTPDAFDTALAGMVERVRASVIDLRRLLDWAQARPAVDGQRIGLVGFSMGAMVAGVAMEHEPRITAAALVMGGADPAAIMGRCGARAARVRDAITARFGWSQDRFVRVARDVLAPANSALGQSLVDPARVLMFDAYYDTCMPRIARDDLWRALGQPERYSLLYDHRVAFLAMTPLGGHFINERIYALFDRVLLDAGPATVRRASGCDGDVSRLSLAPGRDERGGDTGTRLP